MGSESANKDLGKYISIESIITIVIIMVIVIIIHLIIEKIIWTTIIAILYTDPLLSIKRSLIYSLPDAAAIPPIIMALPFAEPIRGSTAQAIGFVPIVVVWSSFILLLYLEAFRDAEAEAEGNRE